MAMPKALEGRLRLPAIAAPMFLASGTDLVVEVCRAGLIGTFPALNQRTTEGLGMWLDEIEDRLAAWPDAAPHGVNLIVHKSNARLAADLDMVVRHKVPLVITSLGAVSDIVDAVHSYGGLVFHDVINRRHAEKAAAARVDGIIAVSAGAGGHGGLTSPFALVSEISAFFSGAIILSGTLNTGRQIAAARIMGADLAYLGTRFVATKEALGGQAYKDMIVRSKAADIVYTSAFSGVSSNFLRESILSAGLDPENLSPHGELQVGGTGHARAWRDIWSAGQGVGGIDDVPAVAQLCERLIEEYREAMGTASLDAYARTQRGAWAPRF